MKVRKKGSGRKPANPEQKKYQFSIFIPRIVLDAIKDSEEVKEAVKALIAQYAGFEYISEHLIFVKNETN